ncbi:hypothetical protein DFJ74DRAFT_293476 [Hyaloraphidium curvatum]|nr:hypothetical protein DFJ74DRAFT_293476 [Hyaloraphidium curvatum]
MGCKGWSARVVLPPPITKHSVSPDKHTSRPPPPAAANRRTPSPCPPPPRPCRPPPPPASPRRATPSPSPRAPPPPRRPRPPPPRAPRTPSSGSRATSACSCEAASARRLRFVRGRFGTFSSANNYVFSGRAGLPARRTFSFDFRTVKRGNLNPVDSRRGRVYLPPRRGGQHFSV